MCKLLRNIYEKSTPLLDLIGRILSAHTAVASIVLCLIFCVLIVFFRRFTNCLTHSQIKQFETEGKYLPPTYIELNKNMEYLRFFIFSRKWKRRIIKQYNSLFDSFEGRRVIRLLGKRYKYKIGNLCSVKSLLSEMEKTKAQFLYIKENDQECVELFGDEYFILRNNIFKYINCIEDLITSCEMISRKNVILKGSAGNGKTSLLCRLSENIMNNNMPCLLLNSRDINGNCTDYFKGTFKFPSKLGPFFEIYLKIVSILLFICGKHFFVFIDAINENDDVQFINSLSNLVEYIDKFPRFKLLLTCRSEYFDARFKQLFSNCSANLYQFDLMSEEYDYNARRKLISAYSEYYNVKGPFLDSFESKLLKSLFLTRIFFEVNANCPEINLEFRNAEIYKLYFKKVSDNYPQIDLDRCTMKVACQMINAQSFDGVDITCLGLSKDEEFELKKILDNNLIMSRSIRTGSGITEQEIEYIYFTFDEFRDFCLARFLLKNDEYDKNNYQNFFSFSESIFSQRKSPIEGILRYAYYHFKSTLRFDLCERILITFGEQNIQSITKKAHWQRIGTHDFNNFGLSLVFMDMEEPIDFELNYINKCIVINPMRYWQIIKLLLRNELYDMLPKMELGLRLITSLDDSSLIERIMSYLSDDKYSDMRYYDSNYVRNIYSLKQAIEKIEKKNNSLSFTLKQFLIIVFSYDPSEYALSEYYNYVLDDNLYFPLHKMICCDELKNNIENFRNLIESRPKKIKQLENLIEHVFVEGNGNV